MAENERSLVEFFHSFDTFSNAYIKKVSSGDSLIPILEMSQSMIKSRNQESALMTRYLSSMKTKTGLFGFLNSSILAKYVYFFLDVDDLCKHKLNVNKNWHKAYKTHLNARIYLLSEETKIYESVNIDIVQSIRHKRAKFYNDYQIEPPRQFENNQKVEEWDDYRKQRAIELLNR